MILLLCIPIWFYIYCSLDVVFTIAVESFLKLVNPHGSLTISHDSVGFLMFPFTSKFPSRQNFLLFTVVYRISPDYLLEIVLCYMEAVVKRSNFPERTRPSRSINIPRRRPSFYGLTVSVTFWQRGPRVLSPRLSSSTILPAGNSYGSRIFMASAHRGERTSRPAPSSPCREMWVKS